MFFHDQTRNLLVYPNTPALNNALSVIPDATRINGSLIAIPQTLRNSQILRHYQFPVAPVITDATFDWPRPPHIKQPYESQKLATNFMVLHPRCFNLSDMGVGKTMSAIWAAEWLMRQSKEPFRVLIVCPLSIMQRVWHDAIWKAFLGKRKVEVLYGDADKRLAGLAAPADYYIVNFDGVGVGAHTRKRIELDGFSLALSQRDDIKLAIVDEASAYKDAQTKRHRIARMVFGQKPYLWLMTGTPTPNRPTDAYGLAKLVNNAFGKSFTVFRDESEWKQSAFRWLPLKNGYEKARQLLTPAIRFDIREVWDAPPVTTEQREVPLTAEQKQHLSDLKRDLQVIVKSGKPITAVNEGAARQKYLQISLGAIYDGEHRYHVINAEPRYAEVEAVIEQAKHKIVVFVPLTSIVDLLYKRLSERWSCAVINGPVPEKERARVIQQFAVDPELKIVICDPGCTAHGINEFVVADTVIWMGATDKNELYRQGVKRVDRPGQVNHVTIVQLVSNPLEREIYRRLDNNEGMQNLLLDMVKRNEL